MKTAVMGMALAGMFGLSGLSTELKAATWSNQDYDFYTGDFNADGNADVLYIAKAAARESGIALSSPDSATILHQSWSSHYLGLPWSGNVLKPLIADFNGDAHADLLLQGTAGGDSHLILMGSDARISAIAQSIPSAWLGLGWSNDQHQLIAGDFNGDGRSDLLLQAVSASGVHAIELADSDGQFTQPARQI